MTPPKQDSIIDFYAHVVVMGGNISGSQVTLNYSHMYFDGYNQN